MPDTQPTTIHSSIHDLRDILKTVCDQWDVPFQTGFGSLSSDTIPRADRTSCADSPPTHGTSHNNTHSSSRIFHTGLHILGKVNIDKSRLDFERTVTSIRAVCAQFDTEVAPEVVKMGPQSEAGFRKYELLLKVTSHFPFPWSLHVHDSDSDAFNVFAHP